MLLKRNGLTYLLGVFRRHPGFERPREQQRTVPECATRRICGSAKGRGFICVAKGHGFIRAMTCATNSFVVAFRPCLVPQRLKPAGGHYHASLRHDSRWKSSGQVPSCPFTSGGPTIEARARPGLPWTCPDVLCRDAPPAKGSRSRPAGPRLPAPCVILSPFACHPERSEGSFSFRSG